MVKQPKQAYLYEIINACIESMDNKKHAVYEHSHKTDEQLMNRVRYEDIRGASCFNEGTDIVEIIADIIYDSVEILPWLKDSTNDYDIQIAGEYPACGKKFLKSREHDWKEGSLVCNHVVVVLGKETDIAGCVTKMYVKTAYPE